MYKRKSIPRLSSKVKLIKTFLISCSTNGTFQNQKGKEEMTESHGQRIHRGHRPYFALSATLFFLDFDFLSLL